LGLLIGSKITVKELLDPQTYGSLSSRGLDSFYGRSWLLYHYLNFSKSRKGQLNEYQHQISLGQNSLAAGKAAFGDFGELDRELRSYLKSRKLTGLSIRKEALTISKIAVRQLREGEAKMMDVRIRSHQRRLNRAEALELVVQARKIADRYPDDPSVQSALAEAEFNSGNDAAAIIASNLALAKDDKDVNAYVQKGYALFRQARGAEDQATAYKKAIAPFLALNKIENDHPLPLMYNHIRFVAQKKEPSKNAIEGLERALELAPFDRGLRFRVVLQQISERRYDWAERNLSALAFDPHGGKLSVASQEVLKRLREDKDVDPSELFKILQK
jgi:tetratricopeptide (TPR) repeat protein